MKAGRKEMSRVDEAFAAVERADFLPEDVRDEAHLDMPIPIGYEQTNSQPSTVRLMLG
jgi:protein-L-isoaspartate(D-aspartate) O-methyltransferase